MVAVGEESGEPVHMLSKLSEYYDLEIKKEPRTLNEFYRSTRYSIDGRYYRVYRCCDDPPHLRGKPITKRLICF